MLGCEGVISLQIILSERRVHKCSCLVHRDDKNILHWEDKMYIRKICMLEIQGFRMNSFPKKGGKCNK